MAKTYGIFGDSISTFQGCNPEGFDVFYEGERLAKTGVLSQSQTWWKLLVGHLGGTVISNAAFSGSLVEGGYFPAGDSERRVSALAGPAGEAPDCIICFIGINDYGWGGAEMNAHGHGSACPSELARQATREPKTALLAPTNQVRRFEKAYASMLNRMRRSYPEAEIWCSTLLPGRITGSEKPQFVYDFRGVPFAAYHDAIRAAARTAGAHVADAACLGMDYESIEGTHPTARGMRQIAGMIGFAMQHEAELNEKFGNGPRGLSTLSIDELPAELLELWPRPHSWRSAALCPSKPCTFCEHATAPHNAWLLTCGKQI